MNEEEIIAEVEETTTLPVIAYEYTPETARALVADFPAVPDFDASLGKKDPVNAEIIRGSKFWNKIDSTREKVRKMFKEPALEYGRAVDARSKELHEIFEPRKIEYAQARKLIDNFEREQEQKRIEEEQERLRIINNEMDKLRMLPSNFIGASSEKLTTIYNSIEIPDDLVFKEKLDTAIEIYKDTMGKLESMIATAKGAEEVEVIRAEAEAKHQAEQKIADDKARAERESLERERAEFEQEKRAMQAEKDARAEAERKKEIEAKADLDAKQRVADALVAEKKASEALKKEDQYCRECEDEARDALQKIIDNTENYAQDILGEIMAGKVPFVKWGFNER